MPFVNMKLIEGGFTPRTEAADRPASMGSRAAAQRAHPAASAANDPATAQGVTEAFHDAELCVGVYDAA